MNKLSSTLDTFEETIDDRPQVINQSVVIYEKYGRGVRDMGRMRRFKMNPVGVPGRIEVILSYYQLKYILAENFLELMKGMNSQL